MVSVTDSASNSYTGIEASILSAALIGIDSVDVEVSGTVRLNQSSRGDGNRINWTTATDSNNYPDGLLADLTIGQAVELQATGSASLDIGSGAL